MRIELHKPEYPPTNLGLGLVEEEHLGQAGIFIKRIQRNSLVEKDGQLHIGDRILKVKLKLVYIKLLASD